jgi:hypothetical protein
LHPWTRKSGPVRQMRQGTSGVRVRLSSENPEVDIR